MDWLPLPFTDIPTSALALWVGINLCLSPNIIYAAHLVERSCRNVERLTKRDCMFYALTDVTER